MTPKRFFTAQDMPIMPCVFEFADVDDRRPRQSSQAVYWKLRSTLPSGKEASRWEKSRFRRAPVSSTAVMPEAA